MKWFGGETSRIQMSHQAEYAVIDICRHGSRSIRTQVNSYSSQFVLILINSYSKIWSIRPNLVNSYSCSGQLVLILVDSYSFWSIRSPGSRGGGCIRARAPPPRHHAKNILLSHILHKIKKKCTSLAQLLLPDVNNQPFGHDSCCYLHHLL